MLAVATGCGSSEDVTVAPPPAAENDCTNVQVPAHEATDVQLTGLDCATARAVILAAVGQGRAVYAAEDFACTPTDAAGGDTNYSCTGPDGARLTFLYGVA